MPNFSTSLFDTIGLIETSNRFDSLSIPDSPFPTDLGTPTAHSSPVGVQHSRAKTGKKSLLKVKSPSSDPDYELSINQEQEA